MTLGTKPSPLKTYRLMPELPEVQTVCNALAPQLVGLQIQKITIRQPKLRWPVPVKPLKELLHAQIDQIARRAKYILFHTNKGTLIIHLGMSGHLKVCQPKTPVVKHDHVDIQLSDEHILRFHDPRRFGAILLSQDIHTDPLFAHLGPEPLSRAFNPKSLYTRIQASSVPIKALIMDPKIVVGVGNIYATESLFSAHIHPLTPGKYLRMPQIKSLVSEIKAVLKRAIKKGGTTLRDFNQPDGRLGYFQQQLKVYGKQGALCPTCQSVHIDMIKIRQRSSFYCPLCQPAQ